MTDRAAAFETTCDTKLIDNNLLAAQAGVVASG